MHHQFSGEEKFGFGGQGSRPVHPGSGGVEPQNCVEAFFRRCQSMFNLHTEMFYSEIQHNHLLQALLATRVVSRSALINELSVLPL